MKKANDNYIKATHLLGDSPDHSELVICIMKHANFLYQTETDFLKASTIARDVLAKPGIDCHILFLKEENLTVDTNMRSHLDHMPEYLVVPQTALAYYILAMCSIKQNDYETARTTLVTFESQVKVKAMPVHCFGPSHPFHVASLIGHIYMELDDYTHAKEAFAFANQEMAACPSEVNCAQIKLCESKLL